MGGRGSAGPSAATEQTRREVQIENRIRAAYRDALAAMSPARNDRLPRNGDRVALADIRDRVGKSVNRQDVDAALKRMAMGGVRFEAQENRQRLTQADRNSVLYVGMREYHFLLLDDPSPRRLRR